jgi:hypothetical protein
VFHGLLFQGFNGGTAHVLKVAPSWKIMRHQERALAPQRNGCVATGTQESKWG